MHTAQLRRRPAATAAAGHPPLAASVVVYVSRHPYGDSTAQAPAARPRRAIASSSHHPPRTVSHARRGFPIVARVLFCVHSSAVRRTRRAHTAAVVPHYYYCYIARAPVGRVQELFPVVARRLRFLVESLRPPS